MEQNNLHEGCIKFPIDFDTKKVVCIPIGRIMLGETIGRLVLSPKGLILYISDSAVKSGNLKIYPNLDDEIEFAGFKPA